MAQSPQLVSDIRTLPVAPFSNSTPNPGSFPRGGAAIGGRVYFTAASATQGREAWVTDGTPAGTRLIADIAAAEFNAFDSPDNNATPLFFPGPNGSVAFFTVNGAVTQLWSWRSDWERPTWLFPLSTATLNPRLAANAIYAAATANNLLFFLVSDGSLWVSDGTLEGTRRVAAARNLGIGQTAMVAVGSRVFFAGGSAAAGNELWVSDGTPAGTRMVADIWPGASSGLDAAAAQQIVAFDGGVVFPANEPTGGQELWRSDGTSQGTVRIANIAPGATSSGASSPTVMDGWVYFAAAAAPAQGLRLWRTQGAGASTSQVSATVQVLTPNLDATSIVEPSIRAAPPLVYFASPGPSFSTLVGRSDGTDAGTFTLGRQIDAFSTLMPVADAPAGGPGRVYFAFGAYGLWTSDGTIGGTTLVRTHAGDAVRNTRLRTLGAANGRLIYAANLARSAHELWMSDGTPAGSSLLKEINPAFSDSVPSDIFADPSGRVYFNATTDALGVERFGVDLAPLGVRLAEETVPGPRSLQRDLSTAVGGGVFSRTVEWLSTSDPFGVIDRIERVMFAPTGSGLGVEVVQFLNQPISNFFAFNNLLLFQAKSPTSSGTTLWRSDGTHEGTFAVQPESDVRPSSPNNFAAFRGRAFFLGGVEGLSESQGGGLYSTDGFTVIREAAFPTANSPTANLSMTVMADHLYFLRSGISIFPDNEGGGSVDTVPLPASAVTGTGLGALEGRLCWGSAAGSGLDVELWGFDGAPANVARVKDIKPGSPGSNPQPFTRARGPGGADVLYFSADDGAHGRELWRTDGTTAGTVLVSDIWPGVASSSPRGLISADGVLYFVANDGAAGWEIWTTDGTPSGTRRVSDVWPGPESAGITGQTYLNGRLYFSATDGAHGRELWTLSISSSSCAADIDGDGTLTPDDLSTFITCYFDSSGCAAADFNGDGAIDPDDLADLITAYFGGC